MPELPEVETIKRQLNNRIRGRKIKEVEVNLPKFVRYPLNQFKKLVKGAVIKNVKRRAKLLIIELSNGYSLVVHLKLTGQLVFNGQNNKHTHLIYTFTDKNWLVHNDLRQFGFVKVVAKKDLNSFFIKESFGPEPLNKEFTFDLFKSLLNKRKKSKIKPLLMDQKFVAGIGNIYADEILFRAKVLPIRKVNDLEIGEVRKIYQAIKEILTLAVKKRGSSNKDYVDTKGGKGSYSFLQKVYQRKNKACFKCKAKIKRIKLGSRSAHFCPQCQK
ncbi:MAG: formamidopyrimidine-DNA glycosylase [Parcubacteria group bacterium]|jgi:formamidopyrimidine-DNA glycosylase|nr:formamidopyrimidine-DNA glycosylase [Parcubacteria group bacterium]|tara:strand:+ start:1841 stop:2656 length:816 start_codon:yes stop_codon:yes gene_type:complete